MATHSGGRSQFRLSEWKKNSYTQVTFNQVTYICGIDDKKLRMRIHTLSCTEKRVHMGNIIFGSMVIGPWYCVRNIEPRYWVPSIGSIGLSKAKTIKRRRSFGKEIDSSIEYLMRSKIWNTGDWFMVHSWIWIKEEPKHYKMDKFYWWVKSQGLNSSIFVWF